MQSRKAHLAEIRSQEKLRELKNGQFIDIVEDEYDDFYYDDEHHNYEAYLRNQKQEKNCNCSILSLLVGGNCDHDVSPFGDNWDDDDWYDND